MQLHKKKIREAKLKPTIDLSKPRSLKYTRNINKTQLIKEERFTEIERENRILFEKIFNIMTRTGNENNF